MSAKLWLSVLASAALGGCAISNEGRVEMRRAIPVTTSPAVGGTSPRPAMVETIWCITCDADQTKGKDGTLGGGVAVEVGDRVSISLKTVLVAEFSESPIFGSDTIPQMIARKDGDPLRANGEIAISATVIDAVRQPAVDPDKAEGRIVFYSDDTIEGQTLNQTN